MSDLEFIASVVTAGAAGRHDPEYPIQAAALALEAGFDKLIVGYDPAAPDGLLVASEILTTTSGLGTVITHVPGLVAPTVAARQYATLAAFHPGRVAMHLLIAPEMPAGQDGDDCHPAARPRRAAEFLEVARLAWSSAEAFTYAGEFYQVAGAGSAVGPLEGRLPVYAAAGSGAAGGAVAGQADVCVLAVADPSEFAARRDRVRAAAARQGHSPAFGISVRLAASPQSGSTRAWLPPASDLPGVIGGSDEISAYVAAGATTVIISHDPQADAAACAEIISRVRCQALGFSGTGVQ